MTTFRVAQRQRYTSIERGTINDKTLSFRARGVLIWLLDKPNDWRCDSEQIANAGKEGRDAIRSALNELAKAGYLQRERVQIENGQWTTQTMVYETSHHTDDGKPGVGDPGVGNPGAKDEDCQTKTVNEKDMAAKAAENDLFDKFWERWPKKIKKPDARRAFRAAVKRDGIEAVSAGVKRWRLMWEQQKTDRQFIPYPASFLNGQQYMDLVTLDGAAPPETIIAKPCALCGGLEACQVERTGYGTTDCPWPTRQVSS